MGIFPQGLQRPFLQQQAHRIDARADAQLATGAGHLGVDGLGRLAGQARDGLAAVMSRHIGHDLSLALGQKARKRTIRRKLRRHETRLAARLHRVHAERRSRGRQGVAQVIYDRVDVVGGGDHAVGLHPGDGGVPFLGRASLGGDWLREWQPLHRRWASPSGRATAASAPGAVAAATGAISLQMKRLEQYLGQPLLDAPVARCGPRRWPASWPRRRAPAGRRS